MLGPKNRRAVPAAPAPAPRGVQPPRSRAVPRAPADPRGPPRPEFRAPAGPVREACCAPPGGAPSPKTPELLSQSKPSSAQRARKARAVPPKPSPSPRRAPPGGALLPRTPRQALTPKGPRTVPGRPKNRGTVRETCCAPPVGASSPKTPELLSQRKPSSAQGARRARAVPPKPSPNPRRAPPGGALPPREPRPLSPRRPPAAQETLRARATPPRPILCACRAPPGGALWPKCPDLLAQ